MRMIRACSGMLVIMLCGCLMLLAACGGQGHASAENASATITATTNPKYSSTPALIPTPTLTPRPPYAFPGAWRNTPGSLLLAGPNTYAFAPSNQQVGYACAGATSTSAKLDVTRDDGASWQVSQGQPGGCGSVFIDAQDANDVFVPQGSSPDQLWRSRDSGATWQALGGIPSVDTGPLGWADVAVIGSRLIASVAITGENSIQNPLLYSDDGGATWQQLAQSVANQPPGYTLTSQFAVVSSTISISGYQGTGTGGLSKLSGSPPGSADYWQSTDGGNTWSPVWKTAPIGTFPIFTRSATGSNYYAISTVTTQIGSGEGSIEDTTVQWSANGGASWENLPDLRGAENGYVVGGAPDSSQIALAPDGTVFLAAQHTPNGGDDAGIFFINPNDPNPAWRPLVSGRVQWWQATVTSGGLRLWGIGSYGGDTYLKYVDVMDVAG